MAAKTVVSSTSSPATTSTSSTTSSSWVFTRVETVVVSARVTGQRVELINRDFSGGVLSPEVVRDLLAKNAHTPVVVLVVRSCKLTALPRELGQLTFLHELDVSDNLLTNLPIELVALTNLAKLTLSGNKFKELPVVGMPSLTTPYNLLRHGTEAICAYLRSSFVALEEKQGELELHVRETFNVVKHADICFVVDGDQAIHAHRLILGLRIASPVFESFLASPNKEHKIEGVGVEAFVRLLRFAYGNGLYDSLNSAEDRAFLDMLDTLQVTTFGRNHRLAGTGTIIRRADAMLRDDFIRLFHTANRISYTPTTTTTTALPGDADEPPSPPPPTPTDPSELKQPPSDLKPRQPVPASELNSPQAQQSTTTSTTANTTRRRGKQKRETRAEREMREFAEAKARRELQAQAERDAAERQARIQHEQAEADELAKKAQVERERQLAAATTARAEAAAKAAVRAASGLMPPGTLLNEAFLRRHGWFADLSLRCASDPPGVSYGSGGEESEDEEAEEENEAGLGAFVCHKFLLCVRSPYFQAKFEGGMSDALDKEIVVDEFERDPISQMLRFLYTDEVSVNADNAQNLLELSGHYQLERLRSVVEKFFGDNIDHDNVLALLHMADHYQAYHLKVFCTSYVIKHQEAVTSGREWRQWRKEHPELSGQLLRLLQA